MANMSYCRFENTANDLRDCMDHFDEEVEPIHDEDVDVDTEYLSIEEGRARDSIIAMAEEIVRCHSTRYHLEDLEAIDD